MERRKQYPGMPYSSRIYSNAAATTIGSGLGPSSSTANHGTAYVTVRAGVNNAAMGSVSIVRLHSLQSENFKEETVVTNRDGSKTLSVPKGTTVRIVAKANTGYVLSQFTGSPTPPATNTAQFETVANQDCTFTAVFREVVQPTYHTLHVAWNRQMGRVTCSTALDADGDARINHGSSVTLKATPLEGCHFVRWEGCTIGGRANQSKTSPEITERLFADRSMVAVFAQDTPGSGGNPPFSFNVGDTFDIKDPEFPTGGGDTPHKEDVVNPADLAAKAKGFLKQWWWAVLVVAFVAYKEWKGGEQ